MKSTGIVGTIASFVICVVSQSPLWAQLPGGTMPYSNGGMAPMMRPISAAPTPDSIPGSSYTSEGPVSYESGVYEEAISSPASGSWGLGGWMDHFNASGTGRNGIIAGGGIVALQADFDTSTAFFVEDQSVSPTFTTNRDFNYQREGSPRIWAGWQDDWGLAFKVTWFEFEDRRSQSETAAVNFVFFNGLPTPTVQQGFLGGGQAGDTVTATSSLEYYTLDAEITQELNFDNWQTTFGGGFRHAAVNQRYDISGTASGVFSSSRSQHRFDGEGPTVFGEFRIPVLGTKDRRHIGSANLSVFGHARGSVLFGNSKLNAVDTTAGPTVDAAGLRDHDSLATGEIRIGVQFDVRPQDGKLFYIRAGWEAQWLDGVGGISSLSADRALVLEGYSFTGGVDW